MSTSIYEGIKKYKNEIQEYLKIEFEFIKQHDSSSASESLLYRRLNFYIAKKAQETTSLFITDGKIRALTAAADIRGLLETLIIAKLCENDRRFTIALFVFFFRREFSFVESMHECILKSVSRLEELEKKDKELVHDQIINRNPIEGLKDESIAFAGATGLYDLDGIHNGFGFSAFCIQKQVVPLYDTELKAIKIRQKSFFLNLIKESYFNNLFPNVTSEKQIEKAVMSFIQTEKIESWQEKAEKVGLRDDYNSIYKITSDVLHVTSFSLFTKGELHDGEKDIFLRMTYNYLKEIMAIINRSKQITNSFESNI